MTIVARCDGTCDLGCDSSRGYTDMGVYVLGFILASIVDIVAIVVTPESGC